MRIYVVRDNLYNYYVGIDLDAARRFRDNVTGSRIQVWVNGEQISVID